MKTNENFAAYEMVKASIGSTVIYSIDEGDLLWPLRRRRGSDQDHTHIGKVIAQHDTPTHLSPFLFLFFLFSFIFYFLLLSAARLVLCFTSQFHFAICDLRNGYAKPALKMPTLVCNGNPINKIQTITIEITTITDYLRYTREQLLKLARNLLGQRLFVLLMKSSFYGHFVAGENRHTIVPTLERLTSTCPPMHSNPPRLCCIPLIYQYIR